MESQRMKRKFQGRSRQIISLDFNLSSAARNGASEMNEIEIARNLKSDNDNSNNNVLILWLSFRFARLRCYKRKGKKGKRKKEKTRAIYYYVSVTCWHKNLTGTNRALLFYLAARSSRRTGSIYLSSSRLLTKWQHARKSVVVLYETASHIRRCDDYTILRGHSLGECSTGVCVSQRRLKIKLILSFVEKFDTSRRYRASEGEKTLFADIVDAKSDTGGKIASTMQQESKIYRLSNLSFSLESLD